MQRWCHWQNDAYGYFLWLFAKLARGKHLQPSSEDMNILRKFTALLDKIEYWREEDSGHWEEAPKLQASSFGTALAGLKELASLLHEQPHLATSVDLSDQLSNLVQKGTHALLSLLPAECVQPGKDRPYDAALLFLVYPLAVVQGNTAEKILQQTTDHLLRQYGVLRYLRDSYWHQDYPDVPQEAKRRRTLVDRDRAVEPGGEAQWCIFDSIMSAIHGLAFQSSRDPQRLAMQRYHLRRALGHVTGPQCKSGAWKLSESFFRSKGSWIPNDVCPLLWTQANLKLALCIMEMSLQ